MKQQVSIFHISELFLYEFYVNRGEFEIREKDEFRPLMEKAAEQERNGGLMAAIQYCRKALEENPVSMEAHEKIVECYRKIGDLNSVESYVLASWPFIGTRSELSWFYRQLGYCYLEKYRPELAQALYRYSTLWQKSDLAENEIAYLERALGHAMPEYSTGELQDILDQEDIPTAASDVTLALLVKAGQEAQKEGNSEQALDCFRMVYDLTGDPEVKTWISSLL